MSTIQRSPRMPLVARKAIPVPGEVLFTRRVSRASVVAECVSAAAGAAVERPVSPSRSSGVRVSGKADQLSAGVGGTASVAVKWRPASRTPSGFASGIACVATGPRSLLANVVVALSRAAMAARIACGRERTGQSPSSSRVAVASAFVAKLRSPVPTSPVVSASVAVSRMSVPLRPSERELRDQSRVRVLN
jgi:hypothetical protein